MTPEQAIPERTIFMNHDLPEHLNPISEQSREIQPAQPCQIQARIFNKKPASGTRTRFVPFQRLKNRTQNHSGSIQLNRKINDSGHPKYDNDQIIETIST